MPRLVQMGSVSKIYELMHDGSWKMGAEDMAYRGHKSKKNKIMFNNLTLQYESGLLN